MRSKSIWNPPKCLFYPRHHEWKVSYELWTAEYLENHLFQHNVHSFFKPLIHQTFFQITQLYLKVHPLHHVIMRKRHSSLQLHYQLANSMLVLLQAQKWSTVHLTLKHTLTWSSNSPSHLEMVFCFKAGQCLTTVLWTKKMIRLET